MRGVIRTSNGVVSKSNLELAQLVRELILVCRLVGGQVWFIMAGHSQAVFRDDERFRCGEGEAGQ